MSVLVGLPDLLDRVPRGGFSSHLFLSLVNAKVVPQSIFQLPSEARGESVSCELVQLRGVLAHRKGTNFVNLICELS